MKDLYLYFTTLEKKNKIVFFIGLMGIILSIIGIKLSNDVSVIRFFDTMHWTFGTSGAAVLSYFGYLRSKNTPSHKTALWFFIGFAGYGLGQIIWDLQVFYAYSGFPTPSDFFYLWLGPSLSVALFYEIRLRDKMVDKSTFSLDLLGLSVAALTLILVSYLPRKGELDTLSMSVLVAYPITLFIPIFMILLMVPTMRLRLNSSLGLFLISITVTALSWMHWNSMALDGLTSDGAWFNISFSIAILFGGFIVSNWNLDFLQSGRFDRMYDITLRLLPILTVIFSSIAIIIVNSFSNPLIEELVYVGAAIVIIVAIIRQSHLLYEREELLDAQEEALKSANVIKTILKAAPLRIFWKDRDLNYLGCNDLLAKDAGFQSSEEMIGKSDFEMGWKENAELYRTDDFSVMNSGVAKLGYEEPQITPDGNTIWLRTSKVPLRDLTSGEVIGILGMFDDITLHHETAERLKYALMGASDGLWDWNMQTNKVYYSPRWFEMLGYKYGDFEETLETWKQLVDPKDQERALDKIQKYLDGKLEKFEVEFRMKHKDGHWVDILSRAKLAVDEQGILLNPLRLVGTHVDISRTKKMQEQLEFMAHYDTLTTLPNRLLFSDRLEHAITQSKRNNTNIAVVYLDLDGFKAVNDMHGHETGDKLLVLLSNKMKDVLREGDTLARLGGDEFVAILENFEDILEDKSVLDRLLLAVSSPAELDNFTLQVSASIGVSFYPQKEAIDADQLIRQSDQAMYQAKQSGKNRYHVFDSENDLAIRTRHESIERMRKALEDDEFVLYYQPKVNMRSSEVVGVEALIRWQHPTRGLVSPGDFLPDLTNTSLLVDVGDWVMRSAMQQIEAWHKKGIHLPISINVDSIQLSQDNFVEKVRALLERYPDVQSGDLEFEILETSALEDVSLIAKIISQCSELGIHYSLDDFGTGYSSLTYLKRLPVKTLKIDQSFVFDLLDDPEELAIIEGIQELADTFEKEIIAEGVESVMHGTILLLMGCDKAQGYAIAKPMPVEEIDAWAKNWCAPSEWTSQISYAKQNLPIVYAIVEHRAWMKQISHNLTHKSDTAQTADINTCKFGKWLKEKGKTVILPEEKYTNIVRLHQEVHALVKILLAKQESEQRELSSSEVKELDALRDELIGCLMELIIK